MSNPAFPDTLVCIRGLSKAIRGQPIVVDVDLDLATNEVVGFAGPNGAGKTTTLRLLAGLLRPDSGAGRVCAREIGCEVSADPHVGYMSQKTGLYEDLTVQQNLAFRAEVYRVPNPRRAMEEALVAHDLHDRRHVRVRDLSGGWARRVQLAAVLLPRPRVLLLDEPTAGLDGRARRALWRRLVDFARGGAGVIVSTHDLEEAELCDRICLFRGGRVVAEGRPEHLVAQTDLEAVLIDADVDQARLGEVLRQEPRVFVSSRGRGARLVAPAARLPDIVAQLEGLGLTAMADRARLADVALANEEAGAPRALS